jgi:hypothetical protein
VGSWPSVARMLMWTGHVRRMDEVREAVCGLKCHRVSFWAMVERCKEWRSTWQHRREQRVSGTLTCVADNPGSLASAPDVDWQVLTRRVHQLVVVNDQHTHLAGSPLCLFNAPHPCPEPSTTLKSGLHPSLEGRGQVAGTGS